MEDESVCLRAIEILEDMLESMCRERYRKRVYQIIAEVRKDINEKVWEKAGDIQQAVSAVGDSLSLIHISEPTRP